MANKNDLEVTPVGGGGAITTEYADTEPPQDEAFLGKSSSGVVHRAKYGFRDSRTVTQAFVEDKKLEFQKFMAKPPKARVIRILNMYFPFTKWLPDYTWKLFGADLLAGLTVGCMLIPQGLSYAGIASLPPQYGLYSGFSGPYIYSLIGTSRQLVVGPVAIISLLVSDAIKGKADPLSPEAVKIAVYLAMSNGFLVLLVGLLKLGFLINFLSHAVVTGFISATAIIIMAQQAKNALGYNIPRSELIHENLKYIFKDISQINGPTVGIFVFFLIMLVSFKLLGKRVRRLRVLRYVGPLLAIILSTVFVIVSNVDQHGVKVVGKIPSGAPPVSVSDWSFDNLKDGMWRHVIIIAVLGHVESIVIGKKLAIQHRYELSHNHELVGLGAANMFGAIFSSYPITGSFSRSAVNNEVGAKTQIAGVVTATMIFVVIMLLTPLFKYTPQAVLAAIIVSAVLGLIDEEEWKYMWKVSKRDLFLALTTFALTAFAGIEWGIGIGVLLSLLFILYESGHPHTAILGRLPHSTVYRNVRQYPEAKSPEGMVILRIDAPIYFANVHYLKDYIRRVELKAGRATAELADNRLLRTKSLELDSLPIEQSSVAPIKFIILDLSPVSSIDTSGVRAIEELNEEYHARGVQIVLSNPARTVMGFLETTGVVDLIGRDWIFVRVHDAVLRCGEELKTMTSSSTSPSSGIAIDMRAISERPDNMELP
eukprot:jgi/Chlat1/4795/Chrsp31S04827